MSLLISVNKITKGYGSRPLFAKLSFGIESGHRIGLVGPNGAGKSTLLKILAGLEEPDAGDVARSRGLRVGYLPQQPKFGSETVEEAVLSGAPDASDPYAYVKAEEIISHLGLNEGRFRRDQPALELSGGQQKKVALARELMKEPDLLLLDEPTNHLDIESLLWLEAYLNEREGLTLLTVTHDRLFLQNISDRIFDLDPSYQDGLLQIEGDYSDYLEARELRLAGQKSQELSQANTLRREMQWLRQGAKARTTKSKSRIQQAHVLMDDVKELRALNTRRELNIQLGVGQAWPKKLIEAKKISKSYDDRVLFSGVDLTLMAGSRVALLGKNGSGKTTFIRALLGEEAVSSGEVIRADHLKANYFEQARQSLRPEETLLQNLDAEGGYVFIGDKPIFGVGYLERFRFRKEQHNLPVKALSGGEQARLLVAKLMLKQAPILVLDEPTNDLDIDTLDTLRDALAQFEGAVILVTHDRFFMEQVSDSILAFPDPEDLLPDEKPGTLFRFESYLQWQLWKDDRKKQQSLRASQARKEKAAPAKPVKMSFKEVHELEKMEPTILEKETKLAELQAEIAKPDIMANGPKLVELGQEIAKLETEIAKLFERWAELQKKQTP